MTDRARRRVAILPPAHPIVRKLRILHLLQEIADVRDAAKAHMDQLRKI